MILKEPAPCCGAPTLLWSPAKKHYVCPCGRMEVNEYGRTKAKRNYMNLTRRRSLRMEEDGWIGVDLDGTLSQDGGWRGPEQIGDSIPEMLQRVRNWLNQGRRVKIFTARACIPQQIPPIRDWLRKHGLPELEITNMKDFAMIESWDDRAVEVVPNTGRPANPLRRLLPRE